MRAIVLKPFDLSRDGVTATGLPANPELVQHIPDDLASGLVEEGWIRAATDEEVARVDQEIAQTDDGAAAQQGPKRKPRSAGA